MNPSNSLNHMALVNCGKGAAGTIYPLDSAEESIAVAWKVEEISPPTMTTTTG